MSLSAGTTTATNASGHMAMSYGYGTATSSGDAIIMLPDVGVRSVRDVSGDLNFYSGSTYAGNSSLCAKP